MKLIKLCKIIVFKKILAKWLKHVSFKVKNNFFKFNFETTFGILKVKQVVTKKTFFLFISL